MPTNTSLAVQQLANEYGLSARGQANAVRVFQGLSVHDLTSPQLSAPSPLHSLQRLIQERLVRNYNLQNVRVTIDRDHYRDGYTIRATYMQPMVMAIEVSELALRDSRESASAFVDMILHQVESEVRHGQRTTEREIPRSVAAVQPPTRQPKPQPAKSRIERLLADDEIFEEAS